MTLDEGKRKVAELLDEYGGGEMDEELEERLPDLFDIAQKRLASVKRILRCAPLEREAGRWECPLPEDCMSLYRVWRNGRICNLRYRLRGNTLLVPPEENAEIEVEYFAMPRTVDGDTPDEYEFEIAEDAAQCMPFFVAAETLSADVMQDGRLLLSLYEGMVNDLDTALPGAAGRVANTLYQGGR